MAMYDGAALIKAAITAKSSALPPASINTLKNPIGAEGSVFELLGANSTVVVGSTSAYGLTRVGYNRISLSTVYPKGLEVLVPGTVDTVYKALPYLSFRTGVAFAEADYVDGPITYADTVGNFVLTASDTNITFTGTVNVKVTKNKTYLNILTNPVVMLANAVYPSTDLTKGQAALFSYSCDPTSKASELSALVAGTTPDQNLVDIVSAITGQTWILTTGEFSLLGATIDYVGPVTALLPTKTGFNNVVVISLSASNCTNFAGKLYLHYN